nr:M2 family metallopeptidase [Rubrobacter xylanophilus]
MEEFVARYGERAAPAERAVSEAWWKLATTGSEEAREELVRAGMEYNEIFSDPDAFRKVRSWYAERDEIGNALLRRQVEVLHGAFAACQGDRKTMARIEELEAEANALYGNHRASVGGREVGENELREILRTSRDDALRREAWEASKSVGREAAPLVRELARLRNQLAREQGHENHYLRSLELQEIEPGELEDIMSRLEEATETPFRELKRRLDEGLKKRFGTDRVMPWHHADPFFQSCREDLAATAGEAPDVDGFFRERDLAELTLRTYDALGLEVRDVLARSDLAERPGKLQHAFCTRIGREYPYDVRVLANVRPGAYWMETLLHEFGHAVYDKHVNPNLPYFLRGYAHLATTEAMALMMGSLAEDPEWLSSVAGVPEAELEGVREYLRERERADRLVFVRWALVMYRFERELYSDPDRDDLNDLWWNLVGRLQLLERPPGRDEPDWAAKIHIAVSPVYYHNYVLGHLIAAQLRDHLERYVTRGPFYGSRSAGLYLLESLFGPGARENWRDTVERATGAPLGTERFVESLHRSP